MIQYSVRWLKTCDSFLISAELLKIFQRRFLINFQGDIQLSAVILIVSDYAIFFSWQNSQNVEQELHCCCSKIFILQNEGLKNDRGPTS